MTCIKAVPVNTEGYLARDHAASIQRVYTYFLNPRRLNNSIVLGIAGFGYTTNTSSNCTDHVQAKLQSDHMETQSQLCAGQDSVSLLATTRYNMEAYQFTRDLSSRGCGTSIYSWSTCGLISSVGANQF